MRRFVTLLSALAVGVTIFSFAAPPSKADDSSVAGTGGAVHMLSPSKTHIRMVSEEVHIWLPEAKVEAHFVFHNSGPATTAMMGFPEQGGGQFMVDSPPRKHSFWNAKYSGFTAFDSYVDGHKVRVKRLMGSENDDQEQYSIWWAKRVHFNRGQTRIVDCDYRGGFDGASNGTDSFTYILQSGSAWHGTIRRARIVCDIRGLRHFDPVHVETPHYRHNGNLIVWTYRNIKPTTADDITIDYNEAFNNVNINGKQLVDGSANLAEYGFFDAGSRDIGQSLACLYGQDVWLQLRTAADWLGANIQWQPKTKSVRLTRGKRWAVVTLGSAKVRNSQGRPVTLSRPAKRLGGLTMVNLDALARAFGGSTHFVARADRVDVTLPKT